MKIGHKIKILVTHPEHWSRGYAPEHGAEVVWVDPGGDHPKRMDGAPTGDGIGQVTTVDGIEQLKQAACSFKPDVFLFAIHHKFEPWVVDAVRAWSGGCKVAMHYTDQRDGVSPDVSKYHGLLDLLLVTNRDPEDHAKYVKAGMTPVVRTMLDGVDLDVYNARATWGVSAHHDVFFGGHNYHGLVRQFQQAGREPPPEIILSGGLFRDRLLGEINNRFDLVVRGTYGWGPEFKVKPPIYHPGYVYAMREGKILLSTTNAPRRGLVTRRTLRSLASGRLFMTDQLLDMDPDMVDGRNIVVYKSKDECLSKIENYLADANERRKVEASGARLVAEKHTYLHRLDDFVRIVKEVF